MIATGTYACRWIYRNKVVPGEMLLEGSRSPGGELFDAPETWVEREGSRLFSGHTETVAVLRSWLRSGHDAVLLDARLHHWWPDRTAVRARMALVGSGLPDGELLFDSVEFQVGGLTDLAGVYPLKSVTLPKPWRPTRSSARRGTPRRPRRPGPPTAVMSWRWSSPPTSATARGTASRSLRHR